MPSGDPWHGRRPAPPELPLDEVVPARAVLTELARGFLLAQDKDPSRATRFAATFLRERSASPAPTQPSRNAFVPSVRRGMAGALRDPTRGPPPT